MNSSMNYPSTTNHFSFSYMINVLPPLIMAALPGAAGGAELIRVFLIIGLS